MYPIISVQGLADLMSGQGLVLVDARVGPDARKRFESGHLTGAKFVDLELELSAKKPSAAEGGRHPLPCPQRFCEMLQQLGVTPNSTIVVYDDKRGANAAARFWWMTRAVGHERVAVLDGGWQAAIDYGLALESGLAECIKTDFIYRVTDWELPTASLSDVIQASQSGRPLIVDVREGFRYRGESEPIDLVAGHIPRAINAPFVENYAESGCFLSGDQLRERFVSLFDNQAIESIIVHCGSGVTACQTILAITAAGLPFPRLYVGSWSEWSRNDLPIAVET